MNPTARSMKWFRDEGWIVDKVEQRLSKTYITRDCFGFADLLVAGPRGIALVQVTDMAHLANREIKARTIPELIKWLDAGGRFLLHGWALKGKQGERKTWQLVQREIIKGNFNDFSTTTGIGTIAGTDARPSDR
jgi:hypothetical protein